MFSLAVRPSLLTLLVLVLVLAACAPPQSTVPPSTATPATPAQATPVSATATAPPSTTTGGTLTIGWGGAPDSLNPGAGYLPESFDIWEVTYETLLTLDHKGNYAPWLATAWEPSADGKVWTITLREGSTWHDGTPLTAEDVVFTFQMIMGFEAFGLAKEYTTRFQEVEPLDPQTVRISLEAPVANMEERLVSVYILPRHIWEQFKDDEQAALEFGNDPLIGSGPFKLAAYQQGEFVRLVANKAHWAAPKIDEIIYRSFANPDALVQALKAGEVDLITQVPATTVDTLRADANLRVVTAPGLSLRTIAFNLLDPANCPPEATCSGHPALRDVHVRRALAHATDKQQLIVAGTMGLARPGLTLVPPTMGTAFNTALQDYAYDPELARQLLEENGYKDSDGDGIREMPNDPSTPLRFRLYIPSDQDSGSREGELLAEMWQEVGVQLDIQVLEPDTVTTLCCPAFDHDILLWGWTAGRDPASLLSLVLSRAISDGTNETGYANLMYDQRYDEQATTRDNVRRTQLIHQLQEILLRDLPYIVPYTNDDIQAFRTDRFSGWVLPAGNGPLYLQDRESLTTVQPLATP